MKQNIFVTSSFMAIGESSLPPLMRSMAFQYFKNFFFSEKNMVFIKNEIDGKWLKGSLGGWKKWRRRSLQRKTLLKMNFFSYFIYYQEKWYLSFFRFAFSSTFLRSLMHKRKVFLFDLRLPFFIPLGYKQSSALPLQSSRFSTLLLRCK